MPENSNALGGIMHVSANFHEKYPDLFAISKECRK